MLSGLAVLGGLCLTSQRTSPAAETSVISGQRWLPVPEIALALLGAVAYGLGNVARGSWVRDWEAPIVGSFIGAVTGYLFYGLVNTNLRKLNGALRGADPQGAGCGCSAASSPSARRPA